MKEATAPDWGIIGMTVEEAADALRVERRAVLAAIADKGLPAVKIGRGWRIDPDALKAWIAKGQDATLEGQTIGYGQQAAILDKIEAVTKASHSLMHDYKGPSANQLRLLLCEKFGIDKVEALPSSDYDAAMQWIDETVPEDVRKPELRESFRNPADPAKSDSNA